MTARYKIVVFVPETHADTLRQAMGEVGAGRIGDYGFCSFSSKGIGRFRPEMGAHPAIGTVGALEAVPEERIEVLCEADRLQAVLAAIRAAHPYEEPATDVYTLVEV